VRKDQIEAIRELRNQVPAAFGKPAEDEEILDAENKLDVILPTDYKFFLKEFGSGGVGGAIILGLSEAEFIATPSFIVETLRIRKEFSEELPEYKNIVVIGLEGSGNPVGFLPQEPIIFTHDHDFGGRYDLAIDFCDYIEKAINRTLDVSF